MDRDSLLQSSELKIQHEQQLERLLLRKKKKSDKKAK